MTQEFISDIERKNSDFMQEANQLTIEMTGSLLPCNVTQLSMLLCFRAYAK